MIFWGAFISSSLNQHYIICLDHTNTCHWRYRVTLDIALVSHELISDSLISPWSGPRARLERRRGSSAGTGPSPAWCCPSGRSRRVAPARRRPDCRTPGTSPPPQTRSPPSSTSWPSAEQTRLRPRPSPSPRWPSGTRWRGAGERSDRSLSPHTPSGSAWPLRWPEPDWTGPSSAGWCLSGQPLKTDKDQFIHWIYYNQNEQSFSFCL